jgi:hypothetical protein
VPNTCILGLQSAPKLQHHNTALQLAATPSVLGFSCCRTLQDAGLGLWALDGLLNVNIGPDNKDNSRAGVAAMSTPADPAPAPDVTSVVVDESSIRSAAMDAAGQQPTQVFVDGTVTESYPTYGTGSAEYSATVEQNPPLDPYPTYTTGGAAQATEQNPPYPTYGTGSAPVYDASSISVTEDYPTYTSGGAGGGSSSSSGGSASPESEHALPAYDFLQNLEYDDTATYQAQTGPNNSPSYVVPRPAEDQVWSTASQYSDTAKMAAHLRTPEATTVQPLVATAAPAAAANPVVVTATPVAPAGMQRPMQQQSVVAAMRPSVVTPRPLPGMQPVAMPIGNGAIQAAVAPGAAAAAAVPAAAVAPRRACEGGEQVWVAGNKYKCRYKRAQQQVAPVQVASGLNTYANGVRAR